MMTIEKARDAAAIIFDADKALVGRTRLQKLACLYELTGVGAGFVFSYHHYGPYSKELSISIDDADAIDLVDEKVTPTNWGSYSIYNSSSDADLSSEFSPVRSQLAAIAKEAGNVEFELAVTAAFIASRDIDDAWDEVRKRKPLKAKSIPAAKKLYASIMAVIVPTPLPNIV